MNISNPDIYTLFAKGDIDGAWIPEPWATMLVEELDGVRLYDESQFWPENQFSSVLLIGRSDYIEKNPDIVKKWINANEKTVEWIKQHPDESKTLYNDFMKNHMGKTFPKKIKYNIRIFFNITTFTTIKISIKNETRFIISF